MKFPIENGVVSLTTADNAAGDVYVSALRLENADPAQIRATTTGGAVVANGLTFDATGRLLYVDATAGLPANTVYSSGLPMSNGALCVSTNAASTVIGGIPFAANGALAAAVQQAIVVTSAADYFFDTFNGTNSSLTGRAGWTAVGDAGKAAKLVADGGVARLLTGFNGEAPYGYQLTADPGAAREVAFEYDWSQHGASNDDPATPFKLYDQLFLLSWQNESNNVNLEFSSRPGGTFRATIARVVGGVRSVEATYNDLPPTGTLRIRRTDRWRVWVNDVVWLSDQLFNDALASYPDRIAGNGTTFGGVGFRHSFFPLAYAKSLRLNPVSITVNDPQAGYGRDATGSRSITFSGTYTGSPASWAWRLRAVDSDTETKPWAPMTVSASGGTWSGSITVPTGSHRLDVAWIGADGLARVATSTPFAVGILVCWYGQSNAAGSSLSGGAWTTTNNPLIAGKSSLPSFSGSTYDRLWMDSDRDSANYMPNCTALARVLSSATGLPVIVIGAGGPGRSIDQLLPGTTVWDNDLTTLVQSVGGQVEHWVWSQGEAEALSASDQATYAANFASMVSAMRSLGGRSDAGVFVRLIGEDTNVAVTPASTQRASAFRALQTTLHNSAQRIWLASHPLGCPLEDSIHFTAAGHAELCRREGLSVARHAYGVLSYDGRGPIVTGGTRAGAVITLTLDLNGATSVAGSNLTGYTVSADDFSTALAVSSVNVSGNTIVIALSAAPAGAVKVGSYRESSYNDSSIAVGSYPDGTTIPVMPIASPITIA